MVYNYICNLCKKEFFKNRPLSKMCNHYCSKECYNKYQKNNSNSGQFKKGKNPWNKNTKGIMKINSGSFISGQIPKNKTSIGSIKIRKYKNKPERAWIKIKDNGNPYDWKLNAIVEWEKINGPIPKGYVVHHKDRNTLNDHINNLEILRRSEHIEEHRKEFKRKKHRKISEEQIKEILNDNSNYKTIAKKYNINKSTVGIIKRKYRLINYCDEIKKDNEL